MCMKVIHLLCKDVRISKRVQSVVTVEYEMCKYFIIDYCFGINVRTDCNGD